jgi:type IV secretory pathway TraG/TraD family ATPase VirD4
MADTRKSRDNAFKGSEIWFNDLRMTIKMLSMVGMLCGGIQLGIFIIAMWLFSGSEQYMFLLKYSWAYLAKLAFLNPAISITWHGSTFVAAASNILGSEAAHTILREQVPKAFFALLISFVAWGVYPLAVAFFKRKATRETQIEHIRGPKLITPEQLNDQLKEEKKECRLPLGEIKIPVEYEPEHLFVVGKTRVGKTVAIMQMIAECRRKDQKAVVYDFKGDYTSKFYNPETDFILNCVDPRTAGWTITNDIKTKMDLISLTQSLIPPGGGDEKFWNSAAQKVFSGLLSAGIVGRKRSNKDLWKAVTASVEDIAAAIQNVDGGAAGYSFLQKPESNQAASIIAVMMSYVAWLEFASFADGDFSIQQWLERDTGGIIFLTGREELQDTLKPMLSLFIDLLGKKFLSLPDNKARRLFVFLDEAATLQRLPSLKRLLIAGGSRGCIVTIGVQDFASLDKIYGKEDSVTIYNSCGNNLVLNVSDPGTADFFSRRFGRFQYWDTNENISMGVQDGRDGRSLSRQKFTEDLILPSEIQGLKKLEGFIKIPEHDPCRTRILITADNNLPDICPSFICREGLDLETIAVAQDERVAAAERLKKTVKDEGGLDELFGAAIAAEPSLAFDDEPAPDTTASLNYEMADF